MSFDALVHNLQISTEYVRKSCKTVGWVPSSKQKSAVEVKVQQALSPYEYLTMNTR